MHARGLRLRGVGQRLAITPLSIWPSALLNDVGTPVAIISQLNTRPTCAPVNASMATSRLAMHDSGSGWIATPFLWSGRTMARTGLRMMPTFPSSSLKFRTAGFPQYGFKAGMSDGAFPFGAWPSRRAVCLRPSCSPLASSNSPFCAGGRGAPEHLRSSGICRSTPGALAPVRVLLSRSINAYSAPSDPLVGTSRLRRVAAYTRCLRCASSSRRPTSGSVLSLCIPARHAALYDRGESIGCSCSVPSPMTRAFAKSQVARHSRVSRHPLQTGECFRGFTGSLLLRPVELLALPADPTEQAARPTRTFTPELSTDRSPFPSSGMTTVATERVPPAGLSPAGTPTSIAALTLAFTTPRRFIPAHSATC